MRLSHNSEKLQEKVARSPAPVLPTCVYTCIHVVITRPKVMSTTIQGQARVP